MLCSKFHCQTVFKCILFFYTIQEGARNASEQVLRQALSGGISKVNFKKVCQLLTQKNKTGNGSKNKVGRSPRRAFRETSP